MRARGTCEHRARAGWPRASAAPFVRLWTDTQLFSGAGFPAGRPPAQGGGGRRLRVRTRCARRLSLRAPLRVLCSCVPMLCSCALRRTCRRRARSPCMICCGGRMHGCGQTLPHLSRTCPHSYPARHHQRSAYSRRVFGTGDRRRCAACSRTIVSVRVCVLRRASMRARGWGRCLSLSGSGPSRACSSWASACGLARPSLTLLSGPVRDVCVATCMMRAGGTPRSAAGATETAPGRRGMMRCSGLWCS